MSSPRSTVIDDLVRFRTPSDPRLSPDAATIAFVVREVDVAKNRNVSRLWTVPVDGSAAPTQWTRGAGSESNPRWSPDGRWLWFVSTRDANRGQLHRLPVGGGEAERITDLPAGALGDFAPAPDGVRVAFTFRETDPSSREDAVEARKKENRSTPPREIVRVRWRTEGTGFLPEAPFRLHVLDGDTRQDTTLEIDGGRDVGGFCWSPDGRSLAFVRNVADDPDRRLGDQGLFVVDLADGAVREIPAPRGPKGSLAWSPDGASIAYLGHDDPDEFWGIRNVHVWVAACDGSGARDLMAGWDATAGDCSLGEVPGRGDSGPIWSDDAGSVWVVVSDQGRVDAWRIGVDGAREQVVRDAVGITRVGDVLAHLGVTPTDAGDVYVGERRLTRVNADLLDEIALREPEVLRVAAPDGQTVPCLALLPPDFAEDPRPRPTLLYLHGGPHLMYGERHLFHEYQALAAAGYVVLFPNPRGSKGYGEAWTGAIKGDWGAPAMADVMACVDDAIARGWADPERLGVVGGSYGGYLTAWIVGHTDRFKAAAPERGVYDLVSMAGTTDFAWRDHGYFAANTTDQPAEYHRNAPLTYAGAVRTPLLIIHSEGDLRCPIGQAEQYFRAVAWAGEAEVRFLRYGPEASHELSRGGPPDLRLDRQRRIHAWFDRFLKDPTESKETP